MKRFLSKLGLGAGHKLEILLLNGAVSGKGGVAAVKYAMDLAGFAGGFPRLPLLPIEEADKSSIQRALSEKGLI